MGKFEEQLEKYENEMKNTLKLKYDADLLRKVAKGCGPSIYNADACKVSGSDKTELATVKKNFLKGKLGLKDSSKLDEGISEVMDVLGSSNRNKYRAIVYYLLAEKFNKQSIYK